MVRRLQDQLPSRPRLPGSSRIRGLFPLFFIVVVQLATMKPGFAPHTKFLTFSGYDGITGVYFHRGSMWLVDPGDGMVFEYNQTDRTWRTHLSPVELHRRYYGPAGRYSTRTSLKHEGAIIVLAIQESTQLTADGRVKQREKIYWFNTRAREFKERESLTDLLPHPDRPFLAGIFGYKRSSTQELLSIPDKCDAWPRVEGLSGFAVVEPDGRRRFYPLPQTRARDFFTWRPDHPRWNDWLPEISEGIGPAQRVGNAIWFGIQFPEGEGFSGVGGVGYFDTLMKKYHLFRPKILRHVSVEVMAIDWPVMWLAASAHHESARVLGTGLLEIDLRTLQLKTPSIRKIRLSDLPREKVHSILTAHSHWWVMSFSGIHRLDKGSGTWTHFAAHLQMKRDVAPTSFPATIPEREPRSSLTPHTLGYRFRKGEIVRYYSTPYAPEEQLEYEVEGRVSRSGLLTDWCWQAIREGGWIRGCGIPVRVHDGRGIVVGAVWGGPAEKVPAKRGGERGGTKEGAIPIKFTSVWLPGDSAIPVIRQVL